MKRLQDKVAIVTGGASGIGLATVERFLDEGARVVMRDINVEAGEAATERFGEPANQTMTTLSRQDNSLSSDGNSYGIPLRIMRGWTMERGDR